MGKDKTKEVLFGMGILFLIIFSEVASDLGNAIVAGFGLSGISEAKVWIMIASIVAVISGYFKLKTNEVI